METINLSEEPVNNYEEIIIEPRTSRREIVSRQSPDFQRAKIILCFTLSTSIFIAIIVALVNLFKNNPYL